MAKVFRITGSFKMGHKQQAFSKEYVAADEDGAREQCLSIFGSKHGVKRRLIRVASVDEVALEDVQDVVVKHQAEST